MGGLSGTAMVNGLIPNYYPHWTGITEKVFMLKDFCTDPSSSCKAPLTKTTNGTMAGTITIPQGSYQLWDFANIGADAFFDIMVIDPTTGNPITFWVIDVDGNPVWPAGSYVPRSDLFLGAGARMQALVAFSKPGIYQLWHANVDTGPAGDANPSVLLGYVNVPPANAAVPAVDVLTPQPAKKWPRPTRAELRAGGQAYPQRSVVFSETPDGLTFFINGKTYDPSRIDTTIQFPSIEEWTITNTSGELHVFHIHQLDYLVEEINGVAQPDNGYQDTITVPYAVNGIPGSVKVLIPFTDPVIIGTFVYHCHILGHEDAGMLANICVEQNPGDCATAAPSAMKHH
jgi:FtsP/CotA-like multicopper oxidase with cupredoxin domain